MRIWPISLGLVIACAAWSQTAPTGYLDSAACARCHRQIAENYARTGMGRSFRSVRAGAALPEFDGTSFDHPASGQQFTASRRDGNYYVRRSRREANALEVPVDYVLGSGDHARSYLRRTSGNRLVEFPVSWYSGDGGHWGMSPGYDRAGHQGFSRQVTYRCMFCHNGYPAVEGRAAEWGGGVEFPSRLPEGIDCQRCHGPGKAHADAAMRGRPRTVVRSSIVNPAKLSAERRLEVCMQCHLETTSAALPGAILRYGREVFSYRPGEPLGDYMLYFDHAPGTGNDEKFEIVSSVYRLRKSACFVASKGKPECTSCHDPHQAASREETLRKSDAVCQGCHAGHAGAVTGCASCHMAQRRAEDARHILITDHKISRRPVTESNMAEGASLPYAGDVAPYYPGQPADGDLYLAIAQIKELSNIPEGLRRLERTMARAPSKSARVPFEMGEALLALGQAARALPYFEVASKQDPREWRYPFKLGQALQAAGQTARAVGEYRRALTLAPAQSAVLLALGSAYSSQGALGPAASALRQAVASDPEDGTAQSNLGNVLLRLGNRAEAERALREGVRLRPELAEIRINLGVALLNSDQAEEAKREFEDAIRAGPSTETARAAWFAALARGETIERAKSAYGASLETQLAAARANLGTALVALGDSEAAIREYRLALSADPKLAATLVNLALTLAARGGVAEARQRLDEALRIDPNLFVAHLKLGEILLSSGQRESAITHLKRAGESPEAHIRRAAAGLLSRP